MAERLFEGRVVYYSGSIKGVPEPDPEFAWKLVQFMIDNRADVLSEHVAARNREEMALVRTKRMGAARAALMDNHPEPWYAVRRQDTEWVDQATHIVALVNGPSHGVGMEIERGLLKPERGLKRTPILALVRADLIDKLTWMIRGIEADEFYLRQYTDLDSACQEVSRFLMGLGSTPS